MWDTCYEISLWIGLQKPLKQHRTLPSTLDANHNWMLRPYCWRHNTLLLQDTEKSGKKSSCWLGFIVPEGSLLAAEVSGNLQLILPEYQHLPGKAAHWSNSAPRLQTGVLTCFGVGSEACSTGRNSDPVLCKPHPAQEVMGLRWNLL